MLESGLARLEELRSALREREELALVAARFEERSEGADLCAAAQRAAVLAIDVLGDDELVELVAQFERAQRFVDAARAHAHAALDARGVCDVRFGHRTKAWLGAEHGLAGPEAGRRLRVGMKLRRHLHVVDDALTHGEITFDHARVLADLLTARVHDTVVAMQHELLALADGVLFERWVQQVRDLIAFADQDGGHDPSPERNRLSMSDGLDGELFLNGTFVGEHAAVLRHSLGAMADRLFHRAKKDAAVAPDDLPTPTRARLLADALVELGRAGTAATHKGPGPAADVTLVIDAGNPTVAHTPDGVRLADGTTRLFLCDPAITAVVRDTLGVPLDMGHTRRFATPEQRRAVAARDGGCVFSGCDVPASQVDLHHPRRFTDDGTTDMANLGGLCRHHHGVVHRNGWSMTATEDQWFIFTTPTGTTFYSQRHGKQRAGPPGYDPP